MLDLIISTSFAVAREDGEAHAAAQALNLTRN